MNEIPIVNVSDYDVLIPSVRQNEVLVDWYIGLACNYDCSYCYPGGHDNAANALDVDVLMSVVQRIVEYFKNFPPQTDFIVNIIGGEPMIVKNVQKLFEFLHKSGIKCIVTTNGSVRIGKYAASLPYLHGVVLSWHYEEANMEHVKELLLLLKDKHDNFSVKILDHVNFQDEVEDSIAFCEEYGIPYVIVSIRIYAADGVRLMKPVRDGIISEEKQSNRAMRGMVGETEVNTDAFTLVNTHNNNFTNKLCTIGYRRLIIQVNGDIYRGSCEQGGIIGNVYDGSVPIVDSPVQCRTDNCWCVPDLVHSSVVNEGFENYLENPLTLRKNQV